VRQRHDELKNRCEYALVKKVKMAGVFCVCQVEFFMLKSSGVYLVDRSVDGELLFVLAVCGESSSL